MWNEATVLEVLVQSNTCTRAALELLAQVSRAARSAVDVHLVSRRGATLGAYTRGLAEFGHARVRSVRLSHVSDNLQHAQALFEALGCCRRLEDLDVSGFEVMATGDHERERFRAAVARMLTSEAFPALRRVRLWEGVQLADVVAVGAQTPRLCALHAGRVRLHAAPDADFTQLAGLRSLKIGECLLDGCVLPWVAKLMSTCRLERLALSVKPMQGGFREATEPTAVPKNTTLQELRLKSCEIDTAQQAQLLVLVLRALPKLRVCDLSDNAFGAHSGASVLSALGTCTELRELDVRDCDLDGTCVEALANIPAKLPALRSFKMKNVLLQNDERRVMAAFSKAPQLRAVEFGDYSSSPAALLALQPLAPVLEVLNLENKYMALGCAKTILQALAGARNLRELLLDGSDLGAAGGLELARIVRECPRLELLSVSTCALGKEGIEHLCTAGDALGSLRKLDVRRNALAAAGGAPLGRLVRHCRALETLRAGHNDLGADGMRAFAAEAGELSACTSLDVCCNSLGVEGVRVIAGFLPQCPQLQKLYLEKNHINSDALAELARQPLCARLDALYLGWNGVMCVPDSREASVDGLAALLDTVRGSPRLRTLSLPYTDLSPAGINLVLAVLPHLPKFQQVDTSSNFLAGRLYDMPAVVQSCRRWGLALD